MSGWNNNEGANFCAGFIRNFIANFGVPMLILVWAGLSYAVPSKVPSGVPRRLFSPHPWHSWDSWTTITVCFLFPRSIYLIYI